MHPAYPSPGQSPPQGAHQHRCEPIQQGRSSSLTFAIVLGWVERPERWPVDIFFLPRRPAWRSWSSFRRARISGPSRGSPLVSSTGTPDILNTAPGTSPGMAPYPVRVPGRGRSSLSALYWVPLGLGLVGVQIPGQVPPRHLGRGPGRRRHSSGAWKDKLTRSGRLGGEVIPDRRLVLEQDDLVHRRGWEDFGGAKLPARRATVTEGGKWRNAP